MKAGPCHGLRLRVSNPLGLALLSELWVASKAASSEFSRNLISQKGGLWVAFLVFASPFRISFLSLNMAHNVLGTELATCSIDPMTGFFRDGCCNTNADDQGMHSIYVVMTDAFLIFTKERGNDLTTPHPDYEFPGLVAGDRWCLCLSRWVEAVQAGCAPQVVLEATHASVTEFVDLETLQDHAVS